MTEFEWVAGWDGWIDRWVGWIEWIMWMDDRKGNGWMKY